MLSEQEVKKIANLARLKLTDEETKEMQKDLSSILDYFKLVQEADISDVPPDFYPGSKNALRDDEVQSQEEADKIMEQAPMKQGRYVEVKEILK